MLSVKEEQEIELEIMQKIHLFCQENALRYIMVYGTLLGAVRHKGFIPWDNDIDIAMPRPDYEKMLELLKTKSVGDHLYHVHYSTDPAYHYLVTRICDDRTIVNVPYIRDKPERLGIWVDIFPVDGLCTSPFRQNLRKLKLIIYKFILMGDLYGMKGQKGLRGRWLYFLHKIMPGKDQSHCIKIEEYAKHCDFDSYKTVSIIIERCWRYQRLTHEDFDHPVLMDFEKYKFFAPKNWHESLSAQYGENYMTPPPESKRFTHQIEADYV